MALAALAFCACSGSTDYPDDRVWTSEHVRYHTRSSDSSCSEISETLERHLLGVMGRFHLPLPENFVLDYYKYSDEHDLDSAGVCPSRASACAKGLSVWTSRAVDRHELTHAYFSSLGPSLRLLEEGIAEALSCEMTTGVESAPSAPWEQAFSRSYETFDQEAYAAAGRFVGFLVNEHGPERFVLLYRSLGRDSSTESAANEFERIYGLRLVDAWQAAASATPELGCLRWSECAGPPLPLFDWQPVAVQCDHGDAFRTLEVPARGSYLFQTLPGSSSRLVSCDPRNPGAHEAHAGKSGAFAVSLNAGRYFVGAPSAGWSVRLDEVPELAAASCADAVPLGILAANFAEGVTTHIDDATAAWVKFAGLDLLQGALSVQAPSTMRVRGCEGCDGSRCSELETGSASAAAISASPGLVFGLDAAEALPQDRWFRLSTTEP